MVNPRSDLLSSSKVRSPPTATNPQSLGLPAMHSAPPCEPGNVALPSMTVLVLSKTNIKTISLGGFVISMMARESFVNINC